MPDTAAIAERYPQFAYLMGHPEIGPLLAQAEEEEWSTSRFLAAIQATNWWRSTSSAERRWADLTERDNMTARRKVEGNIPMIREMATRMGVDPARLDPDTLWTLADALERYGWSEAELRANLANMIGVGGGAPGSDYQATATQVKEIASSYLIPVDESTIAHWVREMAFGRTSIQGIEAFYREQAAQLRPHLRKVFEQGITLRQYAQPLMTQVASILEISPSAVTLDDPRWSQLIDQRDEKTGEVRPMTITEAGLWARNQPEFRRTRRARDEVAELGEQLLAAFGKKAS